jgi:hypothetical protein
MLSEQESRSDMPILVHLMKRRRKDEYQVLVG